MEDLSRTIARITAEIKEKDLHYKSKLSEKITDDNRLNERLSTLEETAKER